MKLPLLLAVTAATGLAMPRVKPRADSENNRHARPFDACDVVNDRYTAYVITLQKHLEDAKSRWFSQMSEDNQRKYDQASSTARELYDTIRRVEYDTGSAIVPSLSQQLDMQHKIPKLIDDILHSRPWIFACRGHCVEFRDALDDVFDIEDSLRLLSLSCEDKSQKVKAVLDSDKTPARPATPCNDANDRYTASVIILQTHLIHATTRWSAKLPEEKQKHLSNALITTDELYTTIRHVDYESGTAVVPTFAEQLRIEPKLQGLADDLAGAKLDFPECIGSCDRFTDAIEAVSGVKDALRTLKISCGPRPGPATEGGSTALPVVKTVCSTLSSSSPSASSATAPKPTGEIIKVVIESNERIDGCEASSREPTSKAQGGRTLTLLGSENELGD